MKNPKLSRVFFFLILVLALTGYSYPEKNTAGSIFKEVERVDLKLDKIIFAHINDYVVVPDGFIILIQETARGEYFSLVKLSKKGDVLRVYEKRGNGPGELRYIENLEAFGKSIFVGEMTAPYFHEFNHNLDFIADHRAKRGGKVMHVGNYIGIWADYIPRVNNVDKFYMLGLYDNKTYEFKKYAFEIPEIPALVQSWGGVRKIDENTYAGIYPTQYQIRLYDKELNFKKNLLKDVPGYIVKYSPWKQNPNDVTLDMQKWFKSWSKIESLFYADGKFLLRYMIGEEFFIDIFDKDGKKLVSQYKEPKNKHVNFAEGGFLWLLESYDEDEDSPKNTLIKAKLDIK
jgi:hypothetical protein